MSDLFTGHIGGTVSEPEPEPELSRDQRRSRRQREVRSRTISVKRLSKAALEAGRQAYPEATEHLRPRTRSECVNGARPCPFVSCVHHLYLDVSESTGGIKINFPDLEPEDMAESCALDVADRGGSTLEEVGAILNLTRERVRQVEVKGLTRLYEPSLLQLADFVETRRPDGKRSLPVISTRHLDRELIDVEVTEDDDEDRLEPEVTHGVVVKLHEAPGNAVVEIETREALAGIDLSEPGGWP